jgi:hypothetical protein
MLKTDRIIFRIRQKNALAYSKSSHVVKFDAPSRPDLRIDEGEVGLGQLRERIHRRYAKDKDETLRIS